MFQLQLKKYLGLLIMPLALSACKLTPKEERSYAYVNETVVYEIMPKYKLNGKISVATLSNKASDADKNIYEKLTKALRAYNNNFNTKDSSSSYEVSWQINELSLQISHHTKTKRDECFEKNVKSDDSFLDVLGKAAYNESLTESCASGEKYEYCSSINADISVTMEIQGLARKESFHFTEPYKGNACKYSLSQLKQYLSHNFSDNKMATYLAGQTVPKFLAKVIPIKKVYHLPFVVDHDLFKTGEPLHEIKQYLTSSPVTSALACKIYEDNWLRYFSVDPALAYNHASCLLLDGKLDESLAMYERIESHLWVKRLRGFEDKNIKHILSRK